MKKLALLIAAFIFVNNISAQQDSKKPHEEKEAKAKLTVEQRAQRSVDNLDKEVTLTADQKTKVYDFALARAKKTDEIIAANKGKEKKEARETAIKANQKEYRQNVKGILTPEQIEKLKAKNKAKNPGKGKGKKAGETSPTDSNAEDLIPSDDK